MVLYKVLTSVCRGESNVFSYRMGFAIANFLLMGTEEVLLRSVIATGDAGVLTELMTPGVILTVLAGDSFSWLNYLLDLWYRRGP